MVYDVIIVGGACGGLTAGIYASRRSMSNIIITKDIGGQTATTPMIENYPGAAKISGPALIDIMKKQAEDAGTKIVLEEVSGIERLKDGTFELTTQNKAKFQAKTLILAFGKTPRSLGVKGEDFYLGKGVSYCVTCDAPFFKRRTVAVIGGGNSAIEGAIMLSKICEKVYLVHRRSEFRGEQVLLDQIESTPNIEKVLGYVPVEVCGDGKCVTGMALAKVEEGASRSELLNVEKIDREIELNGIFVEIGFTVSNSLIAGMIETDKLNQIIINSNQETSLEGVYAAGDVTNTPYKQAVIAAAEGAKAALSAYNYLNDGKANGAHRDWGH